MNDLINQSSNIQANETWEKARPEKLPEPTYWPFFLAMGLNFMFWGMLTTWIIGLAGLAIFAIALTCWINLLRHDRTSN
jgi:hypothetical protein